MTFLAPLLLLAVLPAAAADPAELSYEVRFTEEKMTLDGHAHEKSWALGAGHRADRPALPRTDGDRLGEHTREGPVERQGVDGPVPLP